MSEPITDHAYRPDRQSQWHTGRCDLCGEPEAAHRLGAAKCNAETFHTSTGLCGRCTLPSGHPGEHSALRGPW